jgi:hypothetical protein
MLSVCILVEDGFRTFKIELTRRVTRSYAGGEAWKFSIFSRLGLLGLFFTSCLSLDLRSVDGGVHGLVGKGGKETLRS